MKVRAKFYVATKKESETTPGEFTISMSAVSTGSEENKSFFKYTPAGYLTLSTVNKSAADNFEEGKEYYLDFTAVEQGATVQGQ